MIAKMENKNLILFRVKDSGLVKSYEKEMSVEEMQGRRKLMKELLETTHWKYSSDNILDQSRITFLGNDESDKEFIFEDENGCEYLIANGQINQEESGFRRARAMIPFEYLGKKGGDFDWNIYKCDVDISRNLVNNFVINFQKFLGLGMGLYIYSSAKGSGKTFLSCCILNEISQRYAVSIKFLNVLDFIEMTKKEFRGTTEEVENIYKSRVIVLDDIGVQMSKEWVNTILYRLVNYRYNNKLVTIFTSNVKVEELKIDDRIIDRIESNTYNLDLPEKAIRHDKKKKEKDDLLKNILSDEIGSKDVSK